MLAWNINQDRDGDGNGLNPMTIAPEGDGIAYDIVNNATSPIRLQIQNTEGSDRWCWQLPGGEGSGTVPWSSFNTTCWAPQDGTPFDGKTAIDQIAVMVVGDNVTAIPFDFCVEHLGPAK